ncbi:MAG: AzlC family ABC transporter permease [Fibrobacter sp.]|nr:AzlC family ABC transporter permease [Fibrobacter sp.]
MKFSKGVIDGFPIGIGYFAVSFSFGIAGSKILSWPLVTLISMTNLTSAGQFAGLQIMQATGTLIEMIIATFFINLRYSLMAISLSQKVSPSFGTLQRLFLGMGITDEIYALAIGAKERVNPMYFFGLTVLPYLGWSLGTLCGAIAGEILPGILTNALGVALYGMFIAIVVPQMQKQISTCIAVAISIALSCAFYFVPVLQKVSTGFAIILCAIVASLVCAKFFPIKKEAEAKS